MALWLVKPSSESESVGPTNEEHDDSDTSHKLAASPYRHIKPQTIVRCKKAEKVRAFAYNDERKVITV